MKPRWPDSLSLSSNQGRENDSVSIKHCTGSYSEYIYIQHKPDNGKPADNGNYF